MIYLSFLDFVVHFHGFLYLCNLSFNCRVDSNIFCVFLSPANFLKNNKVSFSDSKKKKALVNSKNVEDWKLVKFVCFTKDWYRRWMCSLFNSFDQGDKVRVVQTLLFIQGINTLLQTLFGTRLPTVIGGSYAFMVPIISIIHDSSLTSIQDDHVVSSIFISLLNLICFGATWNVFLWLPLPRPAC